MRFPFRAIAVFIITFVFLFDAGVGWKKEKKKQYGKTPSITPEKAARETIRDLEGTLSRLSYAMDDYDFDEIHWFLYKIYKSYERLDTLCGQKKRPPTDTSLSILPGEQSVTRRTQAFIDSFLIKMEKKKSKKGAAKRDSISITVRPPIKTKKDIAELILSNPENTPLNLMKAGIRDTGLKIVLDADNEAPRNFVAVEVEKLREKTAKIHRYFDAGKFTMSRTELEWMVDYLSRVKREIIKQIASIKDTPIGGVSTGE